MSVSSSIRTWSAAFRRPVDAARRRRLDELWHALPSRMQTPMQMLGRQWAGCAATIGVMPRCDFACTSCYLGAGANQVRPAPLPELFEQLVQIREHLGRYGNVQITDGEVTLRKERELIALLRRAHELELIPIVMTHGDVLRKRSRLLERLALEGGLREISLHVDTTQRGRLGPSYREATRERELDALRDELAEQVRTLRRVHGVALRVAHTVTVTAHNVGQIGDIVRWTTANADVVRILSFQPVADVGRTLDEPGRAVRVESLWRGIAAALDVASTDTQQLAFGHTDCSRVVMGIVRHARGRAPRWLAARDTTRVDDERALIAFYDRWGGLSFRADSRGAALARGLGVLAGSPGLFARHGPRFTLSWLRRLGDGSAIRALCELASARTRLRPLAIVSHHFMDRGELATPLGRERVDACVFRVPLDGRMVSMCEVNALGLRERYYEGLGSKSARPTVASTP